MSSVYYITRQALEFLQYHLPTPTLQERLREAAARGLVAVPGADRVNGYPVHLTDEEHERLLTELADFYLETRADPFHRAPERCKQLKEIMEMFRPVG